jgi:hypothetical protein
VLRVLGELLTRAVAKRRARRQLARRRPQRARWSGRSGVGRREEEGGRLNRGGPSNGDDGVMSRPYYSARGQGVADRPPGRGVRVWPTRRRWHTGAWRGRRLLHVVGSGRPRELRGLGWRAASGEGRLRSRTARGRRGAWHASAGTGAASRRDVEDHVWFEDRWMVASLCDE